MPMFYDDFGVYDKNQIELDDSAIEIFLDPATILWVTPVLWYVPC